jgi:AcrR family transcriptional regulator
MLQYKFLGGFMSKPQSGADVKLIKAGLKLAKEKGLSGFSVRELCSKAKVNPGLFHYYFTTRETFNKAVLKELYGTLLNDLEISVPKNMPPKDKLIAVRARISEFIENNSSLLSSIVIDVFSGNKEMLSFIKENFTYHIRLALSIIEECKSEGIAEEAAPVNILFSFFLPVIVPNIAASALSKVLDKKMAQELKCLTDNILSERSIEERSRLSLKAAFK